MKLTFKPLSTTVVLVGLLVLATLIPVASSTLVHAGQPLPPASQDDLDVAANGPTLHNPTFDNGHWYEFHLRYQSAYPTGAWVPAGTDMLDLAQDWRLWFLDGTDIVNVDPVRISPDDEPKDEVVKMQSFSWSGKNHQLAGLYQPIIGTTPCLSYKFQIYGQSELTESDDWLQEIKVGIDRVGWHPDSANDPAVHTFPSTMVWGPPSQQSGGYVPLVVTAEAWNTSVAVFTYADAWGSKSHKIYWNTGSFEEATPPELLSDPNNPPGDTSGISSDPTVAPGNTSAIVSWSTSISTLGQVYYHLVDGPNVPYVSPPITFTHAAHLPLVGRVNTNPSWLSNDLDKSPKTSHSMVISGLESGSIYEFFVASRGLSGSECATWVSEKVMFNTKAAYADPELH